ncbi:tungsten cofactor oxidoreductase radical SAM maturase [Dendrosporobacter sp. 1207_IL3150]|uniref:tungsten cofactor oxidoreductase radical SAM maturase n=1 Tax=Dendrosporobacter sp. 1207_IL3150 TaxID=3084054 RepID=UPI002FDA76C3
MNYHRFSVDNDEVSIPLIPDLKKLYIELTTKCNYSCITCIRHSWQDPLTSLSKAAIDKLICDMSELPQLKTIHLGGFGEPLMHPHAIEMIETCKQKGYEVEMITNGSYLTKDLSRQLVDIGLDWIYVSLDGADDDSFSGIRPGASFSEVTSNILQLQEIKQKYNKQFPKLGVEFVATKKNFNRLANMRKLINKLGAHRFIITNVLPYHESMKDQILYDPADFNKGFDLPVQPIYKTIPEMQLRTQRTCNFVTNKAMAITAQGYVSPCYAFMHSYDCYILGRKKHSDAYYFGNIAEQSLADIWMKPEYARFRWLVKHSLYPSCTDCRQVDGCATAQTNEIDCWGNQPSCADCLWARNIVLCP